jgi:hypothetical protein
MVPGKTIDPATQIIKSAKGQPPVMNDTKVPKGKGKKAPPLKPAPKGGKGNPFAKPAFGGK